MESDACPRAHVFPSTGVESGVFKISPLKFASLVTGLFGSGWLYGMGVVALASIVVGFAFDYRIFILAMMLLLLLVPMMLMALYYRYGLRGECYVNVVDHKICVGNGMVLILIAPIPPVMDDDADEERDETSVIKEIDWKRVDYEAGWLGPYTVGSDYVVFPFLPPRRGFLYIPSGAFENEDDFALMVKSIARYAAKNPEISE